MAIFVPAAIVPVRVAVIVDKRVSDKRLTKFKTGRVLPWMQARPFFVLAHSNWSINSESGSTMTRNMKPFTRRHRAVIASLVITLCGCLLAPAMSLAQVKHHLYDATLPPGMVAQRKLLQRQAMVGYFQPVQLVVPAGAQVEVFSDGSFQRSNQAAPVVGLLVGHVYRLKITGIPGHPGREIYPSVEIIDRLYPPAGRETQCPVPVHLPIEDLEPAIGGRLVTRVVYLENPHTAIPEQQTATDQPYFDVALGDDPIRVAEKFGRPMVIVRIGSRVPEQQELNGFGLGTPPLRWFDAAADPRQSSLSDNPVRTVGLQQQLSCGGCRQPGCQACAAVPQTAPLHFPVYGGPPTQLPPSRDELLIDGGDRGLKATVTDQFAVRGLDAEDTIAHFDTLDGRRIVDESNRVAIYAPRFAAVRKLDGLGRTQYNQVARRLMDPRQTKSARRTDFSSTTLQNLQPTGHKSAWLADGLENQTRGVPVDNTTQLKRFDGTFKTFENFRLIRFGLFDNREKGRLAIAIDRANTWHNNLSAQSTLENLQLIVVGDTRTPQETVHIKTEAGRPKLRLVKVASTDLAHPGDVVEFTIRFDNVGDETIGNVTIMDNLTTRLEYIAGSAQCSVPAKFLTSPNNVQSQTLRWEIEEPLNVGKGGIIRFQCRVR